MTNVDSMEARRSQLSEEKRALLGQLLQSAVVPVNTKQGISVRQKQEKSPLSFAQQRLWFLSSLDPASTAYNLVYAIKLKGVLQDGALERSLQAVVQRHEMLRTVFGDEEGSAYQIILDTMNVPLERKDLRDLPGGKQEEAIQEQISLINRVFDLRCGPLLRTALLYLAEEEHVLLLAFHHIVTDGWSHHRFSRELMEFYNSFVCGNAATLPPLRLQYADFANWQREWVQGAAVQEQLSFWKRKLAGAPALLQLPTDYPRPLTQQYIGRKIHFTVPQQLKERLCRLAAEEEATSFMLLMAAFQSLLYRYTEEGDICVGTPLSGRNRKDVESLIGFFVNTLVIRSEVNAGLPFRQLLRHVRKNALDAYANQDVPFEMLVEETAGQRSLSYSPLFQVMFSMQNAPAVSFELTGLTAEQLDVETETSKFDLSLEMFETESGWKGALEYNRSLFEEATIQRLTGHFTMLLSSIADSPDAQVGALPVLSGEERELLNGWNRTSHDYPLQTTLHQLVQAQAVGQLERPAIVNASHHITYGQLLGNAGHLAERLRELGVGPGMITAICLERTPEMVVAQLAVLMTGGAYLPIDPILPKERITYILNDSLASVLLTTEQLRPFIAGTIVAQILYLDNETDPSGDFPLCDFTDAHVSSRKQFYEETAYVIYTSGSTGQPKGTLISHESIINFLHWYRDATALSSSDRVCFASGVGFDLSVAEIWGALVSGASLWLPSEETRLQPELLRDWMLDNGITFAFLPTPLAEQLVSVRWPAATPLRRLFTGGDKWTAKLPCGLPFEVYDLYGPTECTIASTFRMIEPDGEAYQPPHIGRPLANMKIYITDRELRLVPIGVPGEICIGGQGVGGGYLRREELTREKFIPDPFSACEGARIYRSGDIGRYLPDGRIQFLGRADDQVKVRGFRIELAEIQEALATHSSVKEVVVLVREETPGDKRITAYMVGKSGLTLDVESLRQSLREQLPSYMIPSAFVILDRLPVTPSGKIDRQALPMPDTDLSDDRFEEPRNFVEELLCGIWKELLVLEKVGVHQNYFEIGGDSIKTMMLISRARKLGLELTTKQVFQYQTIAELSQAIGVDSRRMEEPPKETVVGLKFDFPLVGLNREDFASIEGVTREEIEDVYPLTPLQDYMLDTMRRRPEPAQFFVNMVMRFKDKLEPELMTEAWQRVANHFALTKTSVVYEGLAEPVQLTRSSIRVPVQYLDWRGWDAERQQEELKRYQERNLLRSDLTYLRRSTTYDVMFATLGENNHQLVMSCSYLMMDGWSHFIVLIQVIKCYYSLLEEKPYELPPAGHYGKYAAWLRSRALEEPRRYWSAELAGFCRATPLVEHAPFNGQPRGKGFAKKSVQIKPAVPHQVRELALRSRVTVNVLFQLAWSLLLARYTDEREVLFGVMSNGRQPEYEGAEDIVGPTINTLPMRVRVDEDETAFQLLQKIQEKQLLLTQWDYTPLRKIREWIGMSEEKALFESYMIFQNLPSYFEVSGGKDWIRDVPLENEYEKALAIFDSGTPLRVDVCVIPEGYEIYMTYLKACFRDEAVSRMLEDLQKMFLGICEASEQPVRTWLRS
ncbi:amino acid adenylation domain-containing protein [Paenibacillus chitinolyticus]|uniref:non-ribosomal peptide synthetase n=1 Tax=Paenibacillus chitinolyticus TaxID=79263 RepID=UPI003557870B